SLVLREIGSGQERKAFLTRDALDFFTVPVLLERARKQGIPVAEFHITTQFDFELPAIIYPLNPFMYLPRVVKERGKVKHTMASLSRNHTFPVCVERIHGKLRREIVLYGKTKNEETQEIGARLWKIYRIPLFIAYFFERRNELWLSGAVPFPSSGLREKRISGRREW
ncbi:MAG: hypothetical protein QW531_05175, partial [Thermoplasmata archaeon]